MNRDLLILILDELRRVARILSLLLSAVALVGIIDGLYNLGLHR